MTIGAVNPEPRRDTDDLTPLAPKSLEDSGLGGTFLLNLMMKVVYEADLDRAVPMSEAVTLPLNLVNLLLEEAVDRELLEILGSESIGSLAGLRYALTSRGR